MPNTPKSSGKKTISLALQGGGAHGAYTWGVLDRLLDEDDIEIEGISGTSAGAMNAAVFVNGYAINGREGARAKLDMFWHKISEAAGNPPNTVAIDQHLDHWNISLSPLHHMLDVWIQSMSPYDINPYNINPLRRVLDAVIDLDALQHHQKIKLFIAATHVKSGHVKVFNCQEINIDVLLASSCLPQIFQAVEIDGEAYWDGGYMGNPSLHPLIYHCDTADIMLVQINPIYRDQIPKLPVEITNRVNEINFNSSLIAEMRAIQFVKKLIHDGKLSPKEYKDVLLHRIYAPEAFSELTATSKLNASLEFFLSMKAIGQRTCDAWLRENKDKIGQECTVDITRTFLHDTSVYGK